VLLAFRKLMNGPRKTIESAVAVPRPLPGARALRYC